MIRKTVLFVLDICSQYLHEVAVVALKPGCTNKMEACLRRKEGLIKWKLLKKINKPIEVGYTFVFTGRVCSQVRVQVVFRLA